MNNGEDDIHNEEKTKMLDHDIKPVNNNNNNNNTLSDSKLIKNISKSNRSINRDTDDESDNEKDFGAIKNLAFKTTVLTQVVSAALDSKYSFEPLPYGDKSLFEDNYGANSLNVNVNPFALLKHIYLPKVPINVCVKGKSKGRHHIFNRFNYTIILTHGPYKWQVNDCNYREIKDVHKILSKLVKNDIRKSCSDIPLEEYEPEWPLFPCEADYATRKSNLNSRCKKLEDYLYKLLQYPPYRDNPNVLDLVKTSPISFLNGVSESYIEDDLHKRFYDYFYFGNFQCAKSFYNRNLKAFSHNRWFCLKDTFLTYLILEKNYTVGFVMLVDRKFECEKKIKAGAYHAISIKNLQRSLILKCKSSQQQNEWFEKLNQMLQGPGRLFNDESLLRYGSYAPVRNNQMCRWYVNGADYMEHVMNGLNNAKEEIYITDWWLCPELFLKRPTDDLQYRLDKILLKKAKEGVKVYILLFKEVSFALNLVSARAKNVLTEGGKNNNIKVLRHAKNTKTNLSFWSHHEKCVIIDQSAGFTGGLDLCFGRWDDDMHRLTDLGKKPNDTELKIQKVSLNKIDIGANLSNNEFNLDSALKSINFLTNVTASVVSTADDPKLSDNLDDDELKVKNHPIVKSHRQRVKEKFKRLKKKVKKQLENDGLNSLAASSDSETGSTDKDDSSDNHSILTFEPTVVPKISDETYYWIGKDYSNAYKGDFKDIHDFTSDQFDRNETPRMPWRDEALVLFGESARDLARHFIQRWNHAKYELEKFNSEYPYLIPKSNSKPVDYDYQSWFHDELFKCKVQITRSLDAWSGGIYKTETSILNAYMDLISKAEHYIYIENQFFVTTSNPKQDKCVRNAIGLALVERIKRAHENNEGLKIYVVLPLLPGFDSMNQIQAVQYYNLRSITFGENSIFKELEKAGITNPSKYITFHGMRNWAILMGKLVQEIIYVHSKLMIVDDKYVICGSANINDRSLIGCRDSELAAVIRDEEFIPSILNEKKVSVGKYSYSLRKKIFRLHVGTYFSNQTKISCTDCASDEFYEIFRVISKQNTKIYEEVFKSLPSDNIKTFVDLNEFLNSPSLSKTDPLKAKKLLENDVNGFIVDFPLEFFSKEKSFFPSINTKEGLLPTQMWT